MFLKRIYLGLLLICLVVFVGGCSLIGKSGISVVTTIFPSYDFVRKIAEDNVNIELLLKPGTDYHSFDPSPQDIIAIEESDIFIYIGTETWAQTIVDSLNAEEVKIIRLMDYIELEEEMIVEGMEHDHEDEHEHNHDEVHDHDHEDEHIDNSDLTIDELAGYDEHVWTSLENSAILVEVITTELINIDNDNKELYEANSISYIDQLRELDEKFHEMIETSIRKEIVVADRFPFTYFANDYDLTINAAFAGCSTATDAKATTIAYLIDKVNNNNIPVVFHIELSNELVANSVVEETNAVKLELNSAHNLTSDEFEEGKTYYDYMLQNYDNLKEALN